MARVRIKFCGLTRAEDVQAALEAGADAIGLNLARGPRRIDIAHARTLARLVRPPVLAVAVLVDADEAAALEVLRATRCQALQLHGDEPPELVARLGARVPVIKAVTLTTAAGAAALAEHPADLLLLDAPGGGSGRGWDYALARQLARPYLLAGGLTPANVGALVAQLQPWGVDCASGIEAAPGIKDAERMRAFVQAAASATAAH